MTRRGSVILILAVTAALLFAAGRWLRPTLSKPLQVAASEGFVGVQTCAQCHPREAQDHAASGHARTFARSVDSDTAQRWDGRVFADPERHYEYRYQFDADGLWATIPARFGDERFPLDFVFGSGTHAVSFLTLVPNRAGGTDGVEHRVSSFGRDEHLALTPGHRGQPANQRIEEFGTVHLRQTTELDRCIECHTTTATIRGMDVVNLLPNVTCESCHGPGAAHVRARQTSRPAAEQHIAAQWSAQAELEMCGRCHRRTDWLSAPPDKHDYKIVRFQPVGLSQSECYQQSAGKLKCTTCHDPHRPPVAEAAHYDRQCLECHAKDRAVHGSCPQRRSSGCAACHMPPIEVHPGFVFADHWIRVRTADDLPVFSKPAADADDNTSAPE